MIVRVHFRGYLEKLHPPTVEAGFAIPASQFQGSLHDPRHAQASNVHAQHRREPLKKAEGRAVCDRLWLRLEWMTPSSPGSSDAYGKVEGAGNSCIAGSTFLSTVWPTLGAAFSHAFLD